MNRMKRALLGGATGTAAVLMLVLGFPAMAQAAEVVYYSGSPFQNQTHSSVTTTMTGGQVGTPGAFIVKIVQAGIGSNEAYGAVGIDHGPTVTYSYCLWRAEWVTGATMPITCKYYH